MVRAIKRVTGTGIPVRGDDIDTDQIVPARFLKEITFDDMGEYAFYDARRDDAGNLNDHPFNSYHGANILVVNDNFGCGSSREHAPQALMRWGIRAIVGESFAEIFRDNCKSLGIPTVTTDNDTVQELQSFIEANPEAGLEVDIDAERVVYDESEVDVAVDPSMKEALIEGKWDTTAIMYQNLPKTRETASKLPYMNES